MKYRAIRFVAIMLAIVLAMTPLTAFATEISVESADEDSRASNYIHSTYATITNNNGRVEVYFQIVGTGTMNSIGAVQIKIRDSSDTVHKIFNYKTTSGMMSYSSAIHMGTVVFYGSASTRYYAEVLFQASNNSGTDNRTYYAS